jgi:4-amino-4-deoxy-L-arabinose transferase-like glycosyltransferase
MSWPWFATSAVVAALVVGAIAVFADQPRRRRIVEELRSITGDPCAVAGVDRVRDRRVVVIALAVTLALAILGAVLIARAPATATGDDRKTVSAAMRWHDALLADGVPSGRPMAAEPKPVWILAGLLSGGTAGGSLRAARSVSLACALLVTLIVCLTAGRRAGPVAALVAGVALVVNPAMWRACSYASDDAMLLLLFGAGTLLVMRALREPRLWPLVGLMAGLAGTCKSTGVVLVVVLVAALVGSRRIDRRTWPWLAAAVVAALVPLAAQGYWVLVQGEVSRDSELLGLLTLHGPQAMAAMDAKRIPEFPGWARTLLDTVGLMKVGDLVVGSVIAFKPFQLWMLPVIGVPAVLLRDRDQRWVLIALLVAVCFVMGLTGWKTGDSAVPFYLLGPVAAVQLATNADAVLTALRRNAAVRIVIVLLVAAMVAELLYRGLAPLG